MLNIVMLIVNLFSIVFIYYYAEGRYAEYCYAECQFAQCCVYLLLC